MNEGVGTGPHLIPSLSSFEKMGREERKTRDAGLEDAEDYPGLFLAF